LSTLIFKEGAEILGKFEHRLPACLERRFLLQVGFNRILGINHVIGYNSEYEQYKK